MRLWLKELRRQAKLQQWQLAEQAGISKQLYSYIETGKRGITVANAKKIAAVLEFEWTKFFEDGDNAAS